MHEFIEKAKGLKRLYSGLMQENHSDLNLTRLNAYRAHFNLPTLCEEEVFLIPEADEGQTLETEILEEEAILEAIEQEDYVNEEEVVYITDDAEEELDEDIIYIAHEEDADPNISKQKTDDERFFSFTCHLCEHTEFPKMKQLSQHCKSIHGSLPKVQCCFAGCGSVLSTWRRLLIHKEKHFPNSDRLHCPTCQKAYTSNKALQIHVETHKNQFICPHCAKAFREIKTLKTHEQTHLKPLDERRNHLCHFPDCGAKFITKQACQNHIGMKHQKSVVALCKETTCKKSFYTRKSYYEHMRNTHGERKYFCNQCDFKARTKQAIAIHKDVHNEGRLFSCDLCEATFPVLRRVKTHMSKYQFLLGLN